MMDSSAGQAPIVLVATLSWNNADLTARCLESLTKLDYSPFEIGLVDNGSTDGSYEWLRERFPEIAFIKHRENLGYGEGVNGQIRHAIEMGADYLLSVDNDATVDSKTLKIMIAAAEEDPKTGIVFSRYVSGSIFLVRMEAVKKIGYLNPRYYIYYDDQDWFERLLCAGYSQRLLPEVVYDHCGAGTVGKNSRAFNYYKTRNELHFRKSHSHKVAFLFFAAARLLTLLGRELPLAWFAGSKDEFKGKVEGLFDFIRGKWGPKDFKLVTPPFWKRLFCGLNTRPEKMLSDVEIKLLNQSRPLRIQVNLDWNIGDEIMANPVLERLKKKYPQSQLDVHARFPALFNNNPFVDSINGGDAFQPDLYFNLHQEFRHRKRSDYLAEIAGVDGWGEPRIYLSKDEINAAAAKWGLSGKKLRIAICPEVWWLTRRWPRDRWIKLAERLEKEKNAQLFILGKEDIRFPVGINLVGKTGLRESSAVMSQCDLFIGHDSGPLYMALAVGTPSVGLYGPLDPSLLYPTVPHFKPVWTEVECRGCWPDGRMIYPNHCPKIVPDCMTSISLDQVWQAVENFSLQTKEFKKP